MVTFNENVPSKKRKERNLLGKAGYFLAVVISASVLVAMVSLFYNARSTGVTLPGVHKVEFAPSGITNNGNCVEGLQRFASELVVYFDTGSIEIGSEKKEQIFWLAKQVDDCSEAALFVIGYADASGSDFANDDVSRMRAYAVRDILTEVDENGDRLLEIDLTKHRYIWLGATESVFVGDAGGESQKLNRRVRFEVHYIKHTDLTRG